MAVGANPYGANASLNARIEAGVTGSEPLMMLVTPERSSDSPSRGRPRRAACSNAKLGAAAKTPSPSDIAPSWVTHRPGRCTKARGLMTVIVAPPIAGRITVSRPMSWNSGSQVTPREARVRPSPSKSCMTLVTTLRCVISTPAGTRVDPEVYCR